jgi:AraC-like DNA-binding protein
MPVKNICKFIQTPISDKLMTHSFVFETDHEAMQRRLKLTTHKVILISEGSGSFFFDGESKEFNKGYLLFAFSGEEAYILPRERCECMYITFDGIRADTLFARFGIGHTRRVFRDFEGAIHFWRECVTRADDNTVDIAAESVLLYTFSRFAPRVQEQDDVISRVESYLDRNFSDQSLSLATLAAAVGYSEKYISHLFKVERGIGINEYLRTLRINHALFLFDHGVDSVKNVALLSGFSDPLYFSSVFKKETGRSPKEYKEDIRRGEKG